MSGIQSKAPSQYPYGFNNGVAIRGMQVLNTYAGTAVWVDSNFGNDGNPGTVALPFATIQGAINGLKNLPSHGSGKRGDVILLKPYHAETITAATTYSLQEIAIIGLSTGDGDMPTLTFTTASSAAISLTGADMRLSGVKFLDNIGLTVALKIAAKGIVVDGCHFIDGSANMVTPISVIGGGSNLADRSSVIGNTFINAGATNGVLLGEVDDQVYVSGNEFLGSYSTAVIQNPTGKILTNLAITGNTIANTHATGVGINLVSACTGSVTSNNVSVTVYGSEINTTLTTLSAGNRGSNSASAQDYPVPLQSTTVTQGDATATTLVSAIKPIPQTATTPGTTIFTITGGPVIITELSMEVTTAVQNQACTVQFAAVDTASSTTTTISGASASIASLGVGGFVRLDPVALSTAPIVGAAGGAYLGNPAAGNGALGGVHVAPGTVGCITSASNTGNIKYHLRYIPLSPLTKVVMA